MSLLDAYLSPNKTLCIYGIINVSIDRAHDRFVLTKENVKKDNPGTTFSYRDEKKRSMPCVILPDFVTTVSSPAIMKTSSDDRKQ
jgi:hypothetical protein